MLSEVCTDAVQWYTAESRQLKTAVNSAEVCSVMCVAAQLPFMFQAWIMTQ